MRKRKPGGYNDVQNRISILIGGRLSDSKVSSSGFIEKENIFPGFTGWQEEYGAFTCAYKDRKAVSKYVEQQHEFHREVSFADEFEVMLKAAGIKRERKYR